MADALKVAQGILDNPLFNQGIGILAGVTGRPRTVGEAIQPGIQLGQAASNRATARIRNEAAREELLGKRRRSKALGLLENLPTDDAGNIDVMNPKTFGILAQIAPDAAISAAMSRRTREGQVLQMMRAAGIDPNSPEGQKMIKDYLSAKGAGGVNAALDRVKLLIEEQRLRDNKTQADKAAKKTADMKLAGERAVEDGVDDVIEMATLVGRLKGSFLEPGVGAEEFRRIMQGGKTAVAEVLGIGTERERKGARALATVYDRFKKLASKGVLDNFKKINEAGGGTITNSKLRLMEEAAPNILVSPDASLLILSDYLKDLVRSAEDLGVTLTPGQLEAINRIQSQARALRLGGEQPTGGAAPASAGRVRDFSTLKRR